MTKLAKILMTAAMVFVMAGGANAWFLDFEWGLGHDGEAIASNVLGVEFTTTDGQDWLYGDMWNTTNYNTTSTDMGHSTGGGGYYMYGYVFAWLGTTQGAGRIDFTNKDGSFFTTGYCANSSFYVEAYDEFDNLIDQAVGGNNFGVGMDFLTVNSTTNNIAYVMIHDSGNYFCVDNMEGDATGVVPPNVPEPTTMVLVGLGLLGIGARLRKRG